jgi:hypothetical protein
MAGGITIDKPSTIKSPVRQVAPPDESTNTRGGGGAKFRVILFNDPVNTKEFVARALMTKAGLDEGSAFQVGLTKKFPNAKTQKRAAQTPLAQRAVALTFPPCALLAFASA